MITATSWVKRGVAAQFPVKYEIDEDEINRISKLARIQLEEAQEDLKEAQEGSGEDSEDEEAAEKPKKKDAAPESKMDEYVVSSWMR